jgi:hypothetical protein
MTTTAPFPTPAISTNHRPPPVVLTAPEQARLRELPEPTREQVLRWLATGDRICTEEARRLLTPPLPSEPPSWSLLTAELLSGLPGCPDRVAAAAGRLASELGDVRSFNVGPLATAAGGGPGQRLASGDRSQGRASWSGIRDLLEARDRVTSHG